MILIFLLFASLMFLIGASSEGQKQPPRKRFTPLELPSKDKDVKFQYYERKQADLEQIDAPIGTQRISRRSFHEVKPTPKCEEKVEEMLEYEEKIEETAVEEGKFELLSSLLDLPDGDCIIS